MRWEERLLDLFDDLEQQAEGLALAERDTLVAEQRRAEYALVDLDARLHASVGTGVLLNVSGLGVLDGRLVGLGDGWCLVDVDGREWIVVLGAVGWWRGLVDRGIGTAARPVTARLGVGSALRGVAETREAVALHSTDGSIARGVLGRVGADFVELLGDPARDEDDRAAVRVVPFSAVAALCGG